MGELFGGKETCLGKPLVRSFRVPYLFAQPPPHSVSHQLNFLEVCFPFISTVFIF